jgi:Fe-S oxidoreductase
MNIKRFKGKEMTRQSKQDANLALTIILLLMISLAGMNVSYIAQHPEAYTGSYPVSNLIIGIYSNSTMDQIHLSHEIFWWTHILLIFIFANILPYSKHFHVFMSVPNVFTSRLKPIGYVENMDNITEEVKLMMDPEAAFSEEASSEEAPERFGVKDVEDLSWKNYMDALSCTECGRCTAVCPANTTGKLLSPRKIMVDLRARMKEKGPQLFKDPNFTDEKSYNSHYITQEEIWACTMCNACAQECPVNIHQPSIILDLRRYQVMEEAAAPTELNNMFTNVENNGAPWQYGQHERMNWLQGFEKEIQVPMMAELDENHKPEYLLWVGSAGAYDDRYKKVTRAFVKILNKLDISFAVLGEEELSSGDTARRAGNEMLFQMQALQNIETMKMYEVKKVLTCDPHVFNTFKNEYPDLGAEFEVIHHTQLLKQLLIDGKISYDNSIFTEKNITYHDPCYLGRANNEYDAPRYILNKLFGNISEMPRNRSFSYCCGAGGAQMFKEAETGDKEVFEERTEEALKTKVDFIATACPYCMTMMTDGIKYKGKEEDVKNYDVAELIEMAMN